MAKRIEAVYGDALFETGEEHGILRELWQEADFLRKTVRDNPEFSLFLNHPRIDREEKIRAVETIFGGKNGLSKEMLGFLRVMLEKGRQDILEKILAYFLNRVKEHYHIGIVFVTAPMELTDRQKKAVEKRILETTHYQSLEVQYQTDPSLIGGLVIRIGDQVADGSIRQKLNGLRRQLISL